MTGFARKILARSSQVRWLVLALVLAVLGGAILLVSNHLRGVVRTQLIEQDGIALYAASMVPSKVAQDLPPEVANEPEVVFVEMADKVIEASLLQEDVIGVRVFDPAGVLQMAIGGNEQDLTGEQLAQLREGKKISSFEPDANLREVVGHREEIRNPLLRVWVPLRQDERFLGAAEFILDGRKVAAALKSLDRQLLLYSGLIFILGGGVTAGALFWAFGRLERANVLLEERTRSLLRANHELTLAAKTSAVGAITAHLIHDLKSPLFGLQSFVSARGTADDEDWNMARDTTRRMQMMIGEIVRILQEEKTTERYELSVDELLSLLRSKLQAQCESSEISLKLETSVSGSIVNRDANVVLLILGNIVHNAIQATPRGGEISVRVTAEAACFSFEVRDTGPGLPEHIKSTLFMPSRSTKTGGTGLGLAISKQLANHIGADLVLNETGPAGTVFVLRVPERLLAGELVAP